MGQKTEPTQGVPVVLIIAETSDLIKLTLWN